MPPGTRNALVPPSPNYLASAGQFVGGVGRGLGTQFVTAPLQLVQQSYEDPYSLGQGIYEGARGLMADPVGVVGNSLRGMWNRAKSSPAGLGEVIGENLDPRNFLKPRKALRKELDVYHGTPHTLPAEEGAPLGRFRSEKIGTGEGAQAYGYGLYFAENEKVAGGYRIAPQQTKYTIDGKNALDAAAVDESLSRPVRYLQDFSYDVAKGDIRSAVQAAVDDGRPEVAKQIQDLYASGRIKPTPAGSLYKVDLPDAKIEQMLDWDNVVDDATASRIMKAVRKHKAAQSSEIDRVKNIVNYEDALGISPAYRGQPDSGSSIYRLLSSDLGGDAKASQFLKDIGIPGIKYFDAGSRDATKGTRNFVVFPGEEQSLNILSRD
jgi:hypothetical protein